MMNVAGTEINLAFKAFEVYLSGCREKCCDGCHNSELWKFNIGDQYNEAVKKRLKEKAEELHSNGLADWAWILGGEPLDQDLDDLEDLLLLLMNAGLKIVLWTHYTKVPKQIARLVEYVKIGPYIAGQEGYEEPVFGVKLANKEQKIVEPMEVAE